MNDRWKDIFIIITLGVLAVLSTITLIELFFVKTLKFDETITIGFIGAILGGALSGAITLIGVNRTIQHAKHIADIERIPMILDNIERISEVIHHNYIKDNYEDDIADFSNNMAHDLSDVYQIASRIDKDVYLEVQHLSYKIEGSNVKYWSDFSDLEEKMIYEGNIESEDELYASLVEKYKDEYYSEINHKLAEFRDFLYKKRQRLLDLLTSL